MDDLKTVRDDRVIEVVKNYASEAYERVISANADITSAHFEDLYIVEI